MYRLSAVCVALLSAAGSAANAQEVLPIVDWVIPDDANPPGFGELLVLDGHVIVGTDAGLIRAFDAVTGKDVWRHSHGGRIYDRGEADDQHLYFASDKGVVALQRDGSQQAWLKPFNGGVGCLAVLPAANLVFVGCYDGFVRALDSATGEQRWETDIMKDAPADPPGFVGQRARFQDIKARVSAAICDDRSVFFSIFDQCRVVGCDARTGELQFTYQTQGWTSSSAAITSDRVLVGSQDNHVYCVDRVTGELRWKFATGHRADQPATIDGGHALFGSSDGGVYCVDLATARQVWKFQTEPDYTGRKFISAKPLVDDQTVYLPTCEGQLYALERATGKLLWKLRADDQSQIVASPATNGRRIFLTTRPDWDNRGRAALVAIDLKPAE